MGTLQTASRLLLGIFFIAAGAGHFLIPEFYLRMMPPVFPAPGFLVAASGALEAFLGICALLDVKPGWTKWGLILLLIAVFPANVYMALNPGLFPDLSPAVLWARLPFQLLFAGWVWFSLKKPMPVTH